MDGLKTCEPRYLMTYLVSSEKAATPANTYHPRKLHGSSDEVPTTRMISATPLPVSMALAGQTKDRVWRKVRAISMTAAVRIAARICGTLTAKSSPNWPRTWIEMITDATCSRGSRMLGRISG